MDNTIIKKWDKKRQSEYHKEWRKKNKEKLQTYQKEWHEENKAHVKQYLEDNILHIKNKQKEYRNAHQEKIRENWKEWYKEHPERSPKRRFTESKNKAIKKKKIEWNLTFEEYCKLIIMPCHYCNNELGEPVKRSVGLDRLDSNLGYETFNVVSCCYICNCIKNEFLTPKETKAAVKAILDLRKFTS
ncbi:MAG: hypothetical protein ACREBJ_03465 [Nitrosotalea sp.]